MRKTISKPFTDIITPAIHAQYAPSPLPGEYSYHMVTVTAYGNY